MRPILPPPLRADTRDLPNVPPFLQALIASFLEPILAWASTLLLRPVLQRCADHPLVQIALHYDPAPVVAACAHYYHHAGPGAKPTYAVAQLVRAEIVRAWADSCGDPELEWLLASNLIVRWFVGLPLFGSTPDHSTLNRFHAWLAVNHPDALFCDVLTFLDRVDPEDPARTPQIVDTFAMASPATPTSGPPHLLRQLSVRLVRLWWQHAPDAVQPAIPPLDLCRLVRPGHWRTPAELQALLQQAVTVASWLADGVAPHLNALDPLRQSTAQALVDAIRKVIADETHTDADGLVTELPAAKKGTYRHMSAVDLESTFRKHEGSPAVFGSNALISTTATRIRAAVALTGSTPDSEAPVAVLKQLRATCQPLPPYLVMDQAGGLGKPRARVAAVSDGATAIAAHIPQSGGADLRRFTPADFRISDDGSWCRCPNGVVSTHAYPTPSADGVNFRFLASECRGCPLWEACRAPESKPAAHRMVYHTPYHAHLRAAAAFNASELGKALIHGRWRVEPTIAWLVRYQGCRQARRIGQAAAECQLLMACAVRNLLLWRSREQRRDTS